MKKLFNLLRHLTPVFEYVGNMNQIHWSSWTATADGVIIMEIGWSTGGGGGYYYVKDNTGNIEIAKMTTYAANGTSETRCFPVIKGHTYQVAGYSRVDGNHLNFFFYKLKLFGGGYGITSFMSTVLSAISSFVRRWSHEQEYSRTVKALDKSQEGRENRSVSVGEIVCNNRLHTSSRSKNCIDFIGQKTERRLDHRRNKRLWQHVLCFVVQQYIQWDAERNGRTGYFVQTVGATALERGCSYV